MPELHLRDCRLSHVLWLSNIFSLGDLLQRASYGLQGLKVLNEHLRTGEALLYLNWEGLSMMVVKFNLFM